jgi:23S rRNA A2030 N6-methylase RlmJ
VANQHFAKLGDVWKHLPLLEALALEPPAAYCETHAGSAWYPLTPSAERWYGVFTFLETARQHPALAASRYRRQLMNAPGSRDALRYPGSPALAMLELGTRAQYTFADTDLASLADLQRAATEMKLGERVSLIATDGVAAINDYCEATPLPPSSVVVHIDPFEPHQRSSPDGLSPIELAARLAERSFRVAYWYGLGSEEERGWAWRELGHPAPVWCGEVVFPARLVYPERTGLWGCGMVFVNFSPSTHRALATLGRELASAYADVPGEHEPPFEFTEYS